MEPPKSEGGMSSWSVASAEMASLRSFVPELLEAYERLFMRDIKQLGRQIVIMDWREEEEVEVQLDDDSVTSPSGRRRSKSEFGLPMTGAAAHYMRTLHACMPCVFEPLPCNIRREGGQSLVIGGPSLVIVEGKGV